MKIPTIGADPEFSFKNGRGRMIEANSVIRHTSGNDQFGLDGCSAIAELRPTPAREPRQLVDNIRSALQSGMAQYPELDKLYWKAGSCSSNDYAQGGHVHFGSRGMGVRSIPTIIRHLDTYVGQIVGLLEDPREARERRRYNEYGCLDDYRTNDHGFEWRTPASWLTSPRIAEGVLCLSHACVVESINGRIHRLPEKLSLPCDDDWADAIYSDQIQKVPGLKKAIKKFKMYKKYQEPIEFIFKLIAEKKTWYPGCDMKEAWGLVPRVDFHLEKLQPVNIEAIWKGVSK